MYIYVSFKKVLSFFFCRCDRYVGSLLGWPDFQEGLRGEVQVKYKKQSKTFRFARKNEKKVILFIYSEYNLFMLTLKYFL